jgi:hypothetical protein
MKQRRFWMTSENEIQTLALNKLAEMLGKKPEELSVVTVVKDIPETKKVSNSVVTDPKKISKIWDRLTHQ